jgi:Cu2+-exporting ATPase
VRKVLLGVKGVRSATVNVATARAVVVCEREGVSVDVLRRVVREIGYELVETGEERGALGGKWGWPGLRLWVAWGMAVGLMVLSMTGLSHWRWAGWLEGVLATVALVGCGGGFFREAWRLGRRGLTNMSTLVALSTGVAYGFSWWVWLFPGVLMERGVSTGLYFETVGGLIAFVLTGKWLEEGAKRRASGAIGRLMGLRPRMATVMGVDGRWSVVATEQVRVGDVVWVRAGERVPMDGVVTEGHSFVDESMMSGEPVAVEKMQGEGVLAGTVNGAGSFWFRVTRVEGESLLMRIVGMMEEALLGKAPMQRLVDRVSGGFVPVVGAIAVLAAGAWMVFGGEEGVVRGVLALVTVLIIACPCALGLATPTAMLVGMGKGAEEGILLRNMECMEVLRGVDTVVLDKTGTLTRGAARVMEMRWLVEETEGLAAVLAGMERASGHPLAGAIVEVLGVSEVGMLPAVEVLPGRGVRALVEGVMYYVGHGGLMKSVLGAGSLEGVQAWVREREAEGRTVVMFGTEGTLLAVFAVADEVKAGSAECVRELQAMGLAVVMATGDREGAARAVAREVGIESVVAGALPEDKLMLIRGLQAEGRKVAMVGDGMNDGAALALADVSVAMGAGSDVAMEVADMTIVSGDLRKIGTAIRLSGDTVAVLRQNLFWALVYNVIGIPLAAGVLYPWTGFLLSPMVAGAAMALSSVSVVMNSLRFNGGLWGRRRK